MRPGAPPPGRFVLSTLRGRQLSGGAAAMRKPRLRRDRARTIFSRFSSHRRISRKSHLADGLKVAVGAPRRLTAAQAATLLCLATEAARDVWQRSIRARGVATSLGALQQVAFLAALSSHRSFDPSRRVLYWTWVRSNTTAAVRAHVWDHLVRQVSDQPIKGKTHPNLRTTGRWATPETVAHDTGLSAALVRRILIGNARGYVLYFPGRRRTATGRPN